MNERLKRSLLNRAIACFILFYVSLKRKDKYDSTIKFFNDLNILKFSMEIRVRRRLETLFDIPDKSDQLNFFPFIGVVYYVEREAFVYSVKVSVCCCLHRKEAEDK